MEQVDRESAASTYHTRYQGHTRAMRKRFDGILFLCCEYAMQKNKEDRTQNFSHMQKRLDKCNIPITLYATKYPRMYTTEEGFDFMNDSILTNPLQVQDCVHAVSLNVHPNKNMRMSEVLEQWPDYETNLLMLEKCGIPRIKE